MESLIQRYESSSKVKTMLTLERVESLKAMCHHYKLHPGKSGIRGVSIKPDYVAVLVRYHSTLNVDSLDPYMETSAWNEPRKRLRVEGGRSKADMDGVAADSMMVSVQCQGNAGEEVGTVAEDCESVGMDIDDNFSQPQTNLPIPSGFLGINAQSESEQCSQQDQRTIAIEAFEQRHDELPYKKLHMTVEENGDLLLSKVALAFNETRSCRVIDPRHGKPLKAQTASLVDGFVRNFLAQTACIRVTFNDAYSKASKSY